MHVNLQLAFWMAHPVLELSLIAAMLTHGLHRRFPFFFAYIVFELVSFGVLFPMQRHHAFVAYSYGYWTSAMINLVVGFKVIHEIFLDVFRPYHTLRDLGTVLFKWAALVMVFVAMVVAVVSPTGQQPFVQAFTTTQRCVRTIQCGLVLFLLFFSTYLGVSRRRYSFGMALGFGTYACMELASNALYFGGQIKAPFVGLINSAMYAGSLLIWFGYCFLEASAMQQQKGILTSQRWEESLTDLRRPASSDSLIPMFEGMVDRAFSQATKPTTEETTTEVYMPKSTSPNTTPGPFALRRAASQR
jgi:hypothetical protein